jgi:hypothetical protein
VEVVYYLSRRPSSRKTRSPGQSVHAFRSSDLGRCIVVRRLYPFPSRFPGTDVRGMDTGTPAPAASRPNFDWLLPVPLPPVLSYIHVHVQSEVISIFDKVEMHSQDGAGEIEIRCRLPCRLPCRERQR